MVKQEQSYDCNQEKYGTSGLYKKIKDKMKERNYSKQISDASLAELHPRGLA